MPWSETLIILERQTVAEAIETSNVPGYPRARLEFALQRVEEAGRDDAPIGRLHAFLFALAALEQHAEQGGLTAAETRRLAAAGLSILRLMRIDPESSKLAFLHADMHRVMGRIHQGEGRSWAASWELWLAGNVTSAQKGDLSANDLHAKGISALRRGHTELALAHFDLASNQSASHETLARIACGKARCLRFFGEHVEARAILIAGAKLYGIEPARKDEIAWELLRLDAFTQEPNAGVMLDAVATGGPHFVAERIIEASLVAMAAPSKRWLGQLRSMRRLSRYKELGLGRQGPLHRAALALEAAQDASIPIGVRIDGIGTTLAEVDAVPTLEFELLVRAAITRWLSRNQQYPLAELVLSEYRGLSLKATNGRRADAIGILDDLAARDWLLARKKPGAA